MITRPLELASRLRPEPRSLDWIFYVNAGLLVLFFSVFGSRFVLAPGLDIKLSQMAGSRAGAATSTHHISVTSAGVIFNEQGPVRPEELKGWLRAAAKTEPKPSLLVRAAEGVRIEKLTEIASAAAEAGFTVQWAAEEPAPGPRPRAGR